ncbi:MAG: hypothetical protein ACLQF4_03990 [Xanthobacteraceae bacterium]
MKVFIREGLYSPEQIADLLLLSVHDVRTPRLRARTILLNRPKQPKPRTSESMMYLMAYHFQQKLCSKGKRCADQTALKKVWGGGGRSLWEKLKARGQTLEEVALSISENTPLKF